MYGTAIEPVYDVRRPEGRGVAAVAARKLAIGRDRSHLQLFEAPLAAKQHDGTVAGEREEEKHESRRLIDRAKACRYYIEPAAAERYGDHYPKRTRESFVYYREHGRVTKFKDLFALSSMKQQKATDAIYEHIVHNYYFPDTRYTFKGFSSIGDDAQIVLVQDFVESVTNARDEDIEEYLKAVGLNRISTYCFGNDLITVTDVMGDNVLVDKEGKLRFIDPVIIFNKPADEVLRQLSRIHFDKVTVYYEDWQLQCCGTPFGIGDQVAWTGHYAGKYDKKVNEFIDFIEEHHVDGLDFIIRGKVTAIHAEVDWRNTHIIYADKADRWTIPINWADGYETPKPLYLWGYYVHLEEVTVEANAR